MNRIQQWDKIRKKLKKEFEDRGITYCELCGSTFNLSFAHRKKRRFYYSRIPGEEERLLGDWNEVLLLCIPCHQKIEKDAELTREVFNRLRT
jgi:5-methylcytosine-specific restriction endonuclease McrA